MPVFPSPGGGGSSIIADYPLINTAGTLSLGTSLVNNAIQFVSPDGNDSHDGLGWLTAKQTLYAAANVLITAGGGTLNYVEGCSVSGPVSGQGLWFQGDGLARPGFLASVPLLIQGYGKSTFRAFERPVPATFTGGGGRTNPGIWVVGSNNPMRFESMQLGGSQQVFAMVGADFDRKTDGTVLNLTVTNATRTGTSTVYTVTLPTGLGIASASRTSNVTTLTVTNPGVKWPPWRVNQIVKVTSTNVNFASGNYTLTDVDGNPGAQATYTIKYAETAADQAPTANIGTVQSHSCGGTLADGNDGEYLVLTSSSSHFVSTQYKVTAFTVDTITVLDVFGDGNQNVNNPGTLAHIEARGAGSNQIEFHNCADAINNQTNSFSGPSYWIGHNNANPTWLDGCWFEGYVGDGTGPRDEDRMAAVFCFPGQTGNGSVRATNVYGTNGSIRTRVPSSGNGQTSVKYAVIESNFIALNLPAVAMLGNSSCSIYCENVNNADASTATDSVTVTGLLPSGIEILRCGKVTAPGLAGDRWDTPSLWASGGAVNPSPWQYGQITQWADGRITGKHPGSPRAFGPVAARFQNVMSAPGSWIGGAHTTITTTGETAPDGTTTAAKSTTTLYEYTQIKPNGADGNTWTVGGRLVICGWMNFDAPAGMISTELFRLIPSNGLTFSEGDSIPVPYNAAGWQFVSAYRTVSATGSTTPSYIIDVGVPTNATVYMWGMTAFYVPSTVNANDFAELVGTVRHQALYLPAGTSGTMEAQKFYGHGGVGVGFTGDTKIGAVDFADGQSAVLSAANKATRIYNNLTGTFQVSINGGAYVDE
jgi:hypothetical protein